MKRLIAILLVGGFLCVGGCSGVGVWSPAVQADYAKVVGKVEAIDWAKVCAWYDKAISGLNLALTGAESLDSNDAAFMEAVVRPCIAEAKTAGDALCEVIQSYKGGTASVTDVVNQAKVVEGAYRAAAAAVGNANKTVAPASTTSADPTK